MRASARQAGLALALLAAGLLTALGGCRASTEADRVAAAIRAFYAALARGDGATACRRLTPAQAELLVRLAVASEPTRRATTCAAALDARSAALDGRQRIAYRDVPVVNVTISGARAQADLLGLADSVDLVSRGGRWLIAAGVHG